MRAKKHVRNRLHVAITRDGERGRGLQKDIRSWGGHDGALGAKSAELVVLAPWG